MKNAVLGLFLTSCLSQKVSAPSNPLDYVWYNFDREVPVEEYSSGFSAINLPC